MPPLMPIRKVQFKIRPWGPGPDPGRELLPYVDDVSLVDLISGYERAAGFDVPGAYAGVVLDHFNFGDLASYLVGQPDSTYWADKGVIALLGCDCGEVGCWPLEAQVIIDADLVTWRGFVQPFRPRRDYGAFGPFTFRRNQYERAVREVASQHVSGYSLEYRSRYS
ncbi:hypothetical protein AAH979_41060 [Plantactinospora sp. ZYX-F-223]|uniref:hypothetical protein n=1 Tax=Plantactinospora sp. ZYX-F-223 TaxID=3144103 RepID=UPI0031FD06E5